MRLVLVDPWDSASISASDGGKFRRCTRKLDKTGGGDEGTLDQLETLTYFVAHRRLLHVELIAVLVEVLLAVTSVCGIVLIDVELLRQVEQGEEDMQTLVLEDQAKELVAAEVLLRFSSRHGY